MATVATTARPGRGPLSALTKTTLASMGIITGLMLYTLVPFGPNPMSLIAGGIALLAAVLVALNFRWAPIVAAVVALALLGLLAFPLTEFISGLGAKNLPMFAFGATVILTAVTALVAGIAAAVQNYRLPAEARRAPRALAALLTLALGLLLGGMAIVALPRHAANAGVGADIAAALPVQPISVFEGGEIRIKAGEIVAVRLANSDPVAHSFDVDELNIHAPMAAGEETVAIFKAAAPGEYTFYCAPHYDKASGQGMHGTLIVE
jgi:plastocyanin